MTDATGIEQVGPERVREWLDRGEAVVVDVREADEAARERIAGSKLAPMSRFDARAVADGAVAGKKIVTVCRSGRRAAEAAARLAATGTTAAVMTGGMEAWKRSGLPVEADARAPLPIMRQVQITAGSLVFAGTVLGAVVSPWFLLVPGFVGAGLVVSGVSGTCGMAALLAMMPWNKARPQLRSGTEPA